MDADNQHQSNQALAFLGEFPRRAVICPSGQIVERVLYPDIPEIDALSRVCLLLNPTASTVPPRDTRLLLARCLDHDPLAWQALNNDIQTKDVNWSIVVAELAGTSKAQQLAQCVLRSVPGPNAIDVLISVAEIVKRIPEAATEFGNALLEHIIILAKLIDDTSKKLPVVKINAFYELGCKLLEKADALLVAGIVEDYPASAGLFCKVPRIFRGMPGAVLFNKVLHHAWSLRPADRKYVMETLAGAIPDVMHAIDMDEVQSLAEDTIQGTGEVSVLVAACECLKYCHGLDTVSGLAVALGTRLISAQGSATQGGST